MDLYAVAPRVAGLRERDHMLTKYQDHVRAGYVGTPVLLIFERLKFVK